MSYEQGKSIEVENQQVDSIESLHDAFMAIIETANSFPIDFDEAWQWVGYADKHKALETLKRNFIEGKEFSPVGVKTSGQKGGRPATYITLTVDCFKAFCMLAQTERGKQVRRYYIELEKYVQQIRAGLLTPNLSDEVSAIKENIRQAQQIASAAKERMRLATLADQKIYDDAVATVAENQQKLLRLRQDAGSQLDLFIQGVTPSSEADEYNRRVIDSYIRNQFNYFGLAEFQMHREYLLKEINKTASFKISADVLTEYLRNQKGLRPVKQRIRIPRQMLHNGKVDYYGPVQQRAYTFKLSDWFSVTELVAKQPLAAN